MADVQEVLIDFKVDYSELTKAQEQLVKSGKIDTADFAKISKAVSTTATDTKGLIAEFKKVSITATQMGKSVEAAFGAGINDALDEAGVSVDEFSDALKKANDPVKSIKTELRELKEALAQAKANGTDTGEAFEALRKRAGQLSDAVADAGAEIKNAGSDTRNIDNVVGSISALAGGFAAVQGAAALFGDENEDLQKALLKVNGAMALATGIQQFYQATLKEGALTKLADSVATGAQTVATNIYTIAVGSSTGALKAFRIALLATGIGAIVALLVMAADAMGAFGDNTDSATKSMEDQKAAADELVQSLDDVADAASKARAAQSGGSDDIKRQIELAKARGKSSKELYDLEQQLRKKELDELRILGQTYLQEYQARKQAGTLSEADAVALAAKITEINRQGKDKNNEIVAAGYEFQREINEKAAESAKKRAEEAEKAAKAAREARLQELRDNLAFIERDLIAVKKNTQEELDLKKKLVRAKRDIELEAEKITAAEAALIRARAVDDQLKLQKEFNEKATAVQLQSQIDTNDALLAGISLNNEERLRLQLENIEATSQLEINAAEGNAAKILSIEAKKQASIRALKNAAIDQQLADDRQAVSRTNRIIKEGLNKIAADEKQTIAVRIAAIQAIGNQELVDVQKRIDANKLKQQSNEEYTRNYKQLSEERADIEDQTAARIRDTIEQDKQTRIENLKAVAAETVNVLSQVADFLSALGQLATEQENQRIDAQKKQLQSLIDAGAISDKQAKIRAQEIEIAERKARQRQAQREKQAAVFNALLAIPTAFLNGLSQGGIYLAAIYAALAAAQAAIIISRPVPKFFRGKKDNYSGPGIVGDMGSELVERNGRMFLYTKPTQTYLNPADKVYTAAETRTILHNTNISTTPAKEKQERFDYDRFAKSIPKHSVAINIEKDFISEAVANGLNKTNYFNKRYQFRK